MLDAPRIYLKGQHFIAKDQLFSAELCLPAGQWTCLLGSSGIGKSTILRLILGLETGGDFNGSIQASDNASLNGRVSFMAQSDLLLPWLSVLDNIVIGAQLRGENPDYERAKSLLERVGLSGHQNKKPPTLSGGMRQRTALARTLMEDRPIVLLDEPFSALDAGTRADMQELAAEVLHGRTVLLVTHEPAEAARLSHQILVMTAQGIDIWPSPKAEIPRDITAKETLSCQGALLEHLRNMTL